MKKDQETEGMIVPLDDEDAVKHVLVETIFDLWKIVNNLTRLRPTKQEHYRVTMFGSARAHVGSFVYDEVKKTAKVLASMGCDIITGGGPGIMQAANEGAAEANASERIRSVGIRVDLPFEQDVNPFVTQAYTHGTFFTRLHHFVLASDAFIVFPGGIGTVLEATMIWQLLQVRHLKDTPLIFAGKMWADLVDWSKQHLIRPDIQLASPEDLEIPTCVNTSEEVVEIIRQHHAAWMRTHLK